MSNFPYTGVSHVRVEQNDYVLAPYGGFTVVYNIVANDSPVGYGLNLTFARCSLNDNFNRKRGVQIALDRMQSFEQGKTVNSDFVFQLEDISDLFKYALPNGELALVATEFERFRQSIRTTETGVLYVRESDFEFLDLLMESIVRVFANAMFSKDYSYLPLCIEYTNGKWMLIIDDEEMARQFDELNSVELREAA